MLVGLGRLAQDDLEVLVPLVRRVRLADLHLQVMPTTTSNFTDVVLFWLVSYTVRKST